MPLNLRIGNSIHKKLAKPSAGKCKFILLFYSLIRKYSKKVPRLSVFYKCRLCQINHKTDEQFNNECICSSGQRNLSPLLVKKKNPKWNCAMLSKSQGLSIFSEVGFGEGNPSKILPNSEWISYSQEFQSVAKTSKRQSHEIVS